MGGKVANGSAAHPYVNPGGPVNVVCGAAGSPASLTRFGARRAFTAHRVSEYGFCVFRPTNAR